MPSQQNRAQLSQFGWVGHQLGISDVQARLGLNIRKLEKFLSGNMNTKIHDESLSAL
jgi:hypothetical protein